MIDLFNGRRTYHIRCEFWKYKKEIKNELRYNEKADGVFYAKREGSEYNQKQQMANAFQYDSTMITLKTPDDVDLTSNDLVRFNNENWLVVNCQVQYKNKSTQYRSKPDKYTYIQLRTLK